MYSIHVFIISWVGQHEKAASIAKAIHGVADKVVETGTANGLESRMNASFHIFCFKKYRQ
jgi:hypothetical protein